MPRSVCGRVTGTPRMAMRPALGARRPASSITSVDLPQPEGPTMDRNSPGRMSNDTPSSAHTSPSRVAKRRDTPATSTKDGLLAVDEVVGVVGLGRLHALHAALLLQEIGRAHV